MTYSEPNYYFIRTPRSCFEDGKIAIGWSSVDLSKNSDIDLKVQKISDQYDNKDNRWLNQPRRFLQMKEGDVVIVVIEGSSAEFALGFVSGSSYFDEDLVEMDRANVIPVDFDWDLKKQTAGVKLHSRNLLTDSTKAKISSPGMTVGDLNEDSDEIHDLMEELMAPEWQLIQRELAEKLVQYRHRQDELINILLEMHTAGLLATKVMDQDEGGNQFPLEEIDPFTFLGNFNRGQGDSKREELWSFIKDKWQLRSDLPSNFDGIPVLQAMSSWFFSYSNQRGDSDISLLWDCFELALSQGISDIEQSTFDQCLNIRGTGIKSLTMGLFWIDPDSFIACDGKNLSRAKKLGISTIPNNSTSYKVWVEALKSKGISNFIAFSSSAYGFSNDDTSPIYTQDTTYQDLTNPFDKLFANCASIDKLLDIFKKDIVIINEVSGPDKQLYVLNLVHQGNSITLNCGNWKILRYWASGKLTVILPTETIEASGAKKRFDFDTDPDEQEYATASYDQSIITNPPIANFWQKHCEHLKKIAEKFSHWKSATGINHHNPTLDVLITSPNQRKQILREGITGQSDRNIWIYAPGKDAYRWGHCKEHQVMTIGWNDTGDLSQLESLKELKSLQTNLSDNACQMLYDLSLIHI